MILLCNLNLEVLYCTAVVVADYACYLCMLHATTEVILNAVVDTSEAVLLDT